MAVTFLEPGGDATFNIELTNTGGFWSNRANATVVTDFVHGGHVKSIKYIASPSATTTTPDGVLADSGSRVSFYVYITVLPTTTTGFLGLRTSAGTTIVQVKLTSGGVLQLWNAFTAQIGSNGATLSTGRWYRISIAYTITSTSVNRFEQFVDGVSSISVTNATLDATGTSTIRFGNIANDATLEQRGSDYYVDNSSSLTDTGDIWVTAKRPNANGTANNFTTQIGSGGSGYGSGHSPQVNERPLDITNGWSVVAVGATTEEYNIESASTGDIDISVATIVDYMGWVDVKALIAETGQIIVNNVTSNISITTAAKVFTKIAGSTTYPAGTGTDIGAVTDATATTVSLYECGIIFAYIPAAASSTIPRKMKMGIGT